jgi:hypothetical protein
MSIPENTEQEQLSLEEQLEKITEQYNTKYEKLISLLKSEDSNEEILNTLASELANIIEEKEKIKKELEEKKE